MINNITTINCDNTNYVDKFNTSLNNASKRSLLTGLLYKTPLLFNQYKTLINFDISELKNTEIDSAFLYIYIEKCKLTNMLNNTFIISKNLSNYDIYNVDWLSAPPTEVNKSINLHVSISDVKKYIKVDVTDFIKSWINNDDNYGFSLEALPNSSTCIMQIASDNSLMPPYLSVTLTSGEYDYTDEPIDDTNPSIESSSFESDDKYSKLLEIITTQESKITSLETSIAKIISSLQEENSTLKDSLQEDITNNLSSIETLTSNIKEINENMDASKKFNDDNATLICDALSFMAKEISIFTNKTKTTFTNVEENINYLFSSIKTLANSVEESSNEKSSFSNEYTANLTNLEDKLTSLAEAISSLQKENSTLKNSLQENIIYFSNSLTKIDSNIKDNSTTSSDEISNIKASITELSERLTKITSSNNNNEDLQGRLSYLEDFVNDITTSIQDTKLLLENNITNDMFNNEISNIKDEVNSLAEHLDTTAIEITKTLNTSKDDFIDLSSKNQLLSDYTISKVLEINNNLSQITSDTSNKFTEINLAITNLHQEISNYDDILLALKQNIENSDEDNEDNNDDSSTLTDSALTSLNDTIYNITSNINLLNDDISKIKETINAITIHPLKD